MEKPTRDASIPSLKPRQVSLRQSTNSDWFEDEATSRGINVTYCDGSDGGCFQLLESVGGGVSVFDYDGDQHSDLLFTGGGHLTHVAGRIQVDGLASALLRKKNTGRFADATGVSNLAVSSSLYTHGCTVTDFNADGFGDVLIAGFGGLQLWQSHGDGTFSEVSAELGVTSNLWNVSAASGDFNRDGLPDLYVVTYADWTPDLGQKCLNDQGLRDICGPTLYPGQKDLFFENTGDGFQNVADRVKLVPANRGLGIVISDIDGNDFLDAFVVNDVQENQLYLGTGAGTFDETGVLAGVAYSNTGEREGSMGVDLGDFDGDGRPDLWYTNYAQQDNSLLKNLSGRGFIHSADVTGLSGVSRPWVGFGTGFADFDGDGWEDIFVANGHVAYERRDSPYFQPPQLFRNEAGRKFSEVKSLGGPYFDATWSGRGAAKGDLNNDGSLDLVVVHQNEPAALLRNRHKVNDWMMLSLVGVQSERSATGAFATIEDGGRQLKRWRIGGGSYLSHSDPRLYFALSNNEPRDVTITWLGGTKEKFRGLQTRQTHVLIEGRGEHVPH